MNKIDFLLTILLVFSLGCIFVYYKETKPRRRAVARCIKIRLKIRVESLEGYFNLPDDFAELIRLVQKYKIAPNEIDCGFYDFKGFAKEACDVFNRYVENQSAMHGESNHAIVGLKAKQRAFQIESILPILNETDVLYES